MIQKALKILVLIVLLAFLLVPGEVQASENDGQGQDNDVQGQNSDDVGAVSTTQVRVDVTEEWPF